MFIFLFNFLFIYHFEFIYFRYWCGYGPDDARNTFPTLKGKKRRLSNQHCHGCQCHFIVSQLYLFPTIARICYSEYRHVDSHGDICHGPTYQGSTSAKSSFAPWLSNDLKGWICEMLHKGFTPQQVLQLHIELVQKNSQQGGFRAVRDTFLTIRDILNVARKLETLTLQTNVDDALSVQNWATTNPAQVFIYQPLNDATNQSFTLGIQTQWQLNMLNAYGNNSLLAMDATFGTNKYKVLIFSFFMFFYFHLSHISI